MSDARERLAWILDVIGSTDDSPAWAVDVWPAPEWDRLSDIRRAPSRALAEHIMATLGLVAVPPELVEAVRGARDDDGPGAWDHGGGMSSRDDAKLALADAVLAQLK